LGLAENKYVAVSGFQWSRLIFSYYFYNIIAQARFGFLYL